MHTIRVALMQVNPQVPFVDSSPSNQIKSLDPYSKRWALLNLNLNAWSTSDTVQCPLSAGVSRCLPAHPRFA